MEQKSRSHPSEKVILCKISLKQDPLNKTIETLSSRKYTELSKNSFKKITDLLNVLNHRKINLILLKSLTFLGIPSECKGLRSIIWKILLNYLPKEPQKWLTTTETQYSTYSIFKKEIIIRPSIISEEGGRVGVLDHPLSVNKDSSWFKYFKDNVLRDEIDKDVRRTRSDIGFFFQAVDKQLYKQKNTPNILAKQMEVRKSDLTMKDRINYIQTHGDVIAQILFIYGKLNPGLSYVQGMNELVGVIYYCFYTDCQKGLEKYIESDAFFCFCNLMSEIRDSFVRTLDVYDSGIKGKMNILEEVIHKCDPEIYNIFLENGISMEFFAIRWVMLLLSQEYPIDQILRLWDSLFADKQRFTFFNYLCTAIIVLKKRELKGKEFPDILKILQDSSGYDNSLEVLKKASQLIALDLLTDDYDLH